MLTKPTLRIGVFFVAVLISGLLATHATFANEAVFRLHQTKKPSQSAGQSTSPPTSRHFNGPAVPKIGTLPSEASAASKTQESKNQDVRQHGPAIAPNNAGIHEPGGTQEESIGTVVGPRDGNGKGPSNNEATGKDSNSVDTRARDANTIDRRITVQPGRPSKNPDKLRELRTVSKPIVPRGIFVRRVNAPAAGGHVARNAIGAAIVRHENVQPSGGAPNDSRPSLPATAAAASFIKADADQEHRSVPLSNSEMTVTPAAANRGVINGTGLTRPRFAPAAVGGPTRMAAGISGTIFRPKH